MKHVDIKYNFIRDAIRDKKVAIKCLETSLQTADITTKSLHQSIFIYHPIGLVD